MQLQTPEGRQTLADSMLQTVNQVLEQEGGAGNRPGIVPEFCGSVIIPGG